MSCWHRGAGACRRSSTTSTDATPIPRCDAGTPASFEPGKANSTFVLAMADAVDDSRLAVSVPRNEVERVLATDEEVDLVLDVVRTNGEREERRIFLAWDREALRHLVDQGGERSIVVIDPDSLQKALDADVEVGAARANRDFMDIVPCVRVRNQADPGPLETSAGKGDRCRDVGILRVIPGGSPRGAFEE